MSEDSNEAGCEPSIYLAETEFDSLNVAMKLALPDVKISLNHDN